jgi:hypothetical protein
MACESNMTMSVAELPNSLARRSTLKLWATRAFGRWPAIRGSAKCLGSPSGAWPAGNRRAFLHDTAPAQILAFIGVRMRAPSLIDSTPLHLVFKSEP